MEESQSGSGAFTLPPEVVEVCDVAKRIVHKELLPLEPEYLPHPGHSFGLKETINLKSVVGDAVLDRLVGIARDTGLWYLMVPEKFGGLGLPMLSQIAILEQFYYTAVPFPFANVPNILYECQGDQIEKFLKPVVEGRMTTCFAQTEPNAGSDPGGMMQTRAVQKGRNWVLNGTKMWISMAAESDLMLVQAVTDPDQRQRGGITMFLVERNNPGVHIEQPGIKTWLSSRSAQYIVHFKDCVVPEEDVLGEIGQGFRLGQRWLTIHDRLLRGPYALGKMQRALDMSIDWAKQRTTFGKPIAERQSIQWKLVDMYVDLTALRAMTYQMAARADAGEDIRAEAGMVKFTSMEWGVRTLDHAIQIHGAMGESLELPLTLFFRHLRHGYIGGGTNEIQRMQVARKLLRG
jgi:acyl-CoA dehydrogenase